MILEDNGKSGVAIKGAGLAIALCFAVAALEGFDIQAIGVAAPKLGPELGLEPAKLGQALAASNIGLVLGAALGGWLADRLGRKPVLTAAVLLFGVFTLATMWVKTFEPLFIVRLLTGLGFGAALPNIMAMAAEVSPLNKRGSTATMMFCGMPAGGAVVAIISATNPAQDWRTLFLIGGLAPIIVAPAIFLLLKETGKAGVLTDAPKRPLWQWLGLLPLYAAAYYGLKSLSTLPGAGALAQGTEWLAFLPVIVVTYMFVHNKVLFGGKRAMPSILLWINFLPTLTILYMILNWLPSLVTDKGFTKADGSWASALFNIGSVVGSLIFGRFVDRFGFRWPLVVAYLGLIGALVGLGEANSVPLVLTFSGLVGFMLMGANYTMYGVAASYYPQAMRGRGSGGTIAWGRIGAVVGPLLAGNLIQAGAGPNDVILAMVPAAIIAVVALLLLSVISKPAEG